jgi:hypothetical protein
MVALSAWFIAASDIEREIRRRVLFIADAFLCSFQAWTAEHRSDYWTLVLQGGG